jgi:hypothetical protein
MATLSAVMRDEPKPVSEVAAGLPHELSRIVARCLRKEPAKRFQHAVDLKVALEELKEESDSGKLTPAAAAKPALAPRRWLWPPPLDC